MATNNTQQCYTSQASQLAETQPLDTTPTPSGADESSPTDTEDDYTPKDTQETNGDDEEENEDSGDWPGDDNEDDDGDQMMRSETTVNTPWKMLPVDTQLTLIIVHVRRFAEENPTVVPALKESLRSLIDQL